MTARDSFRFDPAMFLSQSIEEIMPEIILSSKRKAWKQWGLPTNLFQSEIATLSGIFEEADNPQCAMIKADQIT